MDSHLRECSDRWSLRVGTSLKSRKRNYVIFFSFSLQVSRFLYNTFLYVKLFRWMSIVSGTRSQKTIREKKES